MWVASGQGQKMEVGVKMVEGQRIPWEAEREALRTAPARPICRTKPPAKDTENIPGIEVRTSDGGVGMDIEFTGLEDVTQKELQEHLENLAMESAPIKKAGVHPSRGCLPCDLPPPPPFPIREWPDLTPFERNLRGY
jgi:hypothetical protein